MLSKIVEFLGLAFWVEIVTDNPKCTYYFGPFLSAQEAETAKGGYIEDLENEGAQGIAVTVKRCKPSNLTIFDEDFSEPMNSKLMSNLSGQLS
ncbi:MAG TPA: hypothetical protein DEG17_11495 [Cyanobacteria bacterium UBA11149]|nr:hypothetical protein [Cyanobacteria bacterium UBA11366]HBK65126.1 hypothetical protein [Cyanobacteria bacterium UBA11166]HBR73074.1 hypothetical protein [Cyanobacteria bacterium UBA11159]HBS67711.1 hypothetical protein [Cyanobacteria bacterium UBA11153]HBW89471.1 hypothetical protein [Cyanobacteria bacterium UBA11149]HCA97917.1 hypothetical protein [Cyanobacteria bacterium UBA9226]